MKILVCPAEWKITDGILVDVGDPPDGVNETQFLMRLCRHLKFHEMSLPMIATALDLNRNRFGKLEIPQGGTPQSRAQEEIRKLAVKYMDHKAGAEDTVDQLVKTINAMNGRFSP